MRWGILWSTTVLIACTAATIAQGKTNIDNIVKTDDVDAPSVLTTVVDENTEIISTVGEDVTESFTTTTEYITTTTTETSVERSSEQKTSEENIENPPADGTTEEDDGHTVTTTEPSDSGNDGSVEDSNPVDSTGENVDPPCDEDLIISTKSGEVQGFVWQNKENIISYIDIPYGSVKNYFQAATAVEQWTNIHNVKDHNKRCPQLEGDTVVGEIDCLTLSIFKPQTAERASVLFHIHADNFETGSGDPSIYGPDYLIAQDIILVLPNYRLGPLGFLCIQNETAPGNMALKDLSLALSWINNNIEAFGGDPDNIAVSGEGRSGALAGLLALSPISKEYVNKVITESGSFLSYWALDREPSVTAEKILDRLHNEDRLSLTDLALSKILQAAKGLQFRPCLEMENDNAFMTETPFKTVTSETFEKTSFLLGSAMYAGTHEALLQTADSISQLNDDFTLLLPDDLSFNTLLLKTQAGNRVKRQYFGDSAINLQDLKSLSLCFTDAGYLGPGIRSARLLVKADAVVYFYEFAYVGDMNAALQAVNHPVDGAVRGDIVGYLFTQDGRAPGPEQSEESKMIESLTKMWTNFLKTGSPATEEIVWNNLNKESPEIEEEWLLIDNEPSMKKGVHIERLSIWTDLYEQHFIEGSHGQELSPSVYTILVFQLVFWFSFWKNASHIN